MDCNADAQGVFRAHDSHFEAHCPKSVLHVSLQKYQKQPKRQRAKITIPSDLSTTSPNRHRAIDFDDMYLAECLRQSHCELAGSWAKRHLSARKLRYIRLSQNSAWSDSASNPTHQEVAPSRLLASGAGPGTGEDARPFTEEKLMHLYKYPKTGKARYTWVHWARRVALSNTAALPRPHTSSSSQQQHSVLESERSEDKEGSVVRHHISPLSDTFTTVHFVHTLSTLRILVALVLILVTSALAALLWVFLGVNGGWLSDVQRQRGDRVGSGMAVGVLVLLLELLGFGAWVWRS
ncbi:hypothetical protein EJ07DRAFT_126547 [Lizonia empirigonia]|nr:hypothetical protein EJ07DRAFT_126547 [Lizonia empirigonia]